MLRIEPSIGYQTTAHELPKEYDHSLMDCKRGRWRVSNTLVTRVEADITSLLEY